jgi:hypothetical protein
LFCLIVLCAGAAWALPYYQLRDVSGQRDGHTVAGSQWFAIVREGRLLTPTTWVSISEDTHGGDAPAVTMVTSADLLYDFNSVYLDDPQHDMTMGDDASFDPINSVYLVIKEGRGELRLDFGNDFARHTPYLFDGPQDVMEDVLLSVPSYMTRVVPSSPQLVASEDWLPTEMSFQADSPQSYGSSLGYLTFRQSGSFDYGFEGFRESAKIPLIVANVFDGTAAEPGNELYFDMTVLSGDTVVTRRKFRWNADENVTHDFGTFFMILPEGSAPPPYSLLTKITNRTGTRYRSQRYDSITSADRDVYPSHWTYDLTPDLYGSLPASFPLDPQSQIAPGLVTVYTSSMDTVYSSSESFRLYPYQGSAAPSDLRLTYRKVGGMTPLGDREISSSVNPPNPPWSVRGFNMTFADVIQNAEKTDEEIMRYIGGKPVTLETLDASGVTDIYIKADAFNAFTISSDVSSAETASDDVALLPAHVRLRVSRKEAPIVDRWNDIADADSVIDAFANICAVWVRSPNAAEQDMNLFTTLRNRGYSAEKCVQAFTYEDFLYLDFIVFLADAASETTGKTAFCQVFEDDKVPYILIGDGKKDGSLNLSFYVALTGDNPVPGPAPDSGSSGGGGGCQGFGIWGLAASLSLFLGSAARFRK